MTIYVCVDAYNYPIRAFATLEAAKAYRNGIYTVIATELVQ